MDAPRPLRRHDRHRRIHPQRARHFRWHTDPNNIPRSLDLIEQIAQRYAGHRSVTAFSVINEPEPSVGPKILRAFFEQAYDRVRRHMPADEVAFVVAAYPESELAAYHGCLGPRANVWTDVHLYQSFGNWEHMPLLEYLAYPLQRQHRLRPQLARGPVIVGEWSLGLAAPQRAEILAMPVFRQELIMRMHGQMLLAMLEEFAGWFFWSYRVDDRPDWSFRDAVERGWLPSQFAEPSIQEPPCKKPSVC